MNKDKFLSISLLILSASILVSSFVVSNALKKSSEILSNEISFSMASASSKISSTLNRTDFNNNSIKDKDILDEREAAEYLGIPRDTFVKVLSDKDMGIPNTFINGRYLLSKSALNKWLEESHSNFK